MNTMKKQLFWGASVLLAALLLSGPAQAQLSEEAPSPEVRQALQAYEAGDFKAARRQFGALSRKGLAVGQFNLAMMHIRDEITPSNLKLAESLLLKAAGQGFVHAEHALGQFYDLGLGGKSDRARAMQWTALAAEHGHPDAQMAYATAHYLGRGTALNKPEAAKWYREVAKTGDVGAQYLLASMYETGDGVSQDLRLALYWYQNAAMNGDIAARIKAVEVDKKLKSDTPASEPTAPASAKPI
jgi:uncharacterized protein